MSLLAVGCSGTSDSVATTATPTFTEVSPDAAGDAAIGERFPTVLDVEVRGGADTNTWQFAVTLSSEYDSPEQYADAWRVLDADDNELGIRVLTHDHANEQPFTRSGTVTIPDGVDRVFVEGRDLLNGWSGQRFELEVLQFEL